MVKPLLRTNYFEINYFPLDYSIQSVRTCQWQAIEPQVGRPDCSLVFNVLVLLSTQVRAVLFQAITNIWYKFEIITFHIAYNRFGLCYKVCMYKTKIQFN